MVQEEEAALSLVCTNFYDSKPETRGNQQSLTDCEVMKFTYVHSEEKGNITFLFSSIKNVNFTRNVEEFHGYII